MFASKGGRKILVAQWRIGHTEPMHEIEKHPKDLGCIPLHLTNDKQYIYQQWFVLILLE